MLSAGMRGYPVDRLQKLAQRLASRPGTKILVAADVWDALQKLPKEEGKVDGVLTGVAIEKSDALPPGMVCIVR